MTTNKQVTEPAKANTDAPVTEPAKAQSKPKGDPRKLVYVYDSRTGNKVDRSVPETWLTQFPHLKEQSSKKAGK